MCASLPTIASSPRAQCDSSATRFDIVPLATKTAASLPVRSAAIASSRRTVGSSPSTSSPTGASAIARRISSEGSVTVSERRSMMRSGIAAGLPERLESLAAADRRQLHQALLFDDLGEGGVALGGHVRPAGLDQAARQVVPDAGLGHRPRVARPVEGENAVGRPEARAQHLQAAEALLRR